MRSKEPKFADEAAADAHLTSLAKIGEVIRDAALQANVSMFNFLNGEKSKSMAAVRRALVVALTAQGLTRTEVAKAICVTVECVGGILPRTYKRPVPYLSHGISKTQEYRAWQTMRLRCGNPANAAYASYGGRGIMVCERWKADVVAFVADMGEKPTRKHEIDRIDNDKGYTCGKCADCQAHGWTANCRWATRRENDRNRRSSSAIEFKGETLTIAEWSERTGLKDYVIRERLDHNWTIERALTSPPRVVKRRPIEEMSLFKKYSDELVAQVRRDGAEGMKVTPLAAKYGMPRGYVKQLLLGKIRVAS